MLPKLIADASCVRCKLLVGGDTGEEYILVPAKKAKIRSSKYRKQDVPICSYCQGELQLGAPHRVGRTIE